MVTIFNVSIMVFLGWLFIFLYRRKNKSRVAYLEDIQINIEAQNKCIASLATVANSASNLLVTIGLMIDTGQIKLVAGNSFELAQAFKEIGYKINDHINNEDSHYPCSLIVGECFDDTNNCLLILEQIIQQCDQKEVRDIIHTFKISKRKQNAEG